ncbi:MAG: undecaprenyl-phosphate galactose phosphotransferase WbaP [Planctomycetota bacterium]
MAEPVQRDPLLGQLLVDSGAIRGVDLEEALKIQDRTGQLLGTILLEMGLCNRSALSSALLKQNPFVEDQVSPVTQRRTKRPTLHLIGFHVTTKPLLSWLLLVATDILSLALAVLLAACACYLLYPQIIREVRTAGLLASVLVLVCFTAWRLHSLVALGPVEELRRSTILISLVCLGIACGSCVYSHIERDALVLIFVFWACAVFFVPVLRTRLRQVCAKRPWWGHPVVLLGAGDSARRVLGMLRRHPELGLKPVAALDDDPEKIGQIEGVPVLGCLNIAPVLARDLKVRRALVVMPSVPPVRLMELLELHASAFSYLLIVPNLLGLYSMLVPAHDLGGVLSLEVKQNLLLPSHGRLKRTMDVGLTFLGGLLISPLLLFIAVLIKLDSGGPVFYTGKRLGKNGQLFNALKFRTMYGDGEEDLEDLLAKNAALREEYEKYHKLKKDPRVTRVGRTLRRYSLDELPQLWNVLRGDMSLVGPRPYIEREIPDMNRNHPIVFKVLPGMTGLWQVSARNKASFTERVETDVFYVRNWSLWLDLYVFAKTAEVVLSGTGT